MTVGRSWISRRGVLLGCAGLGATIAAPLGCAASPPGACPPEPPPEARFAPPSAELETLVASLIDVPTNDVFGLCTDLLRTISPDALLGGLLAADARAIEPDSGGSLHAALCVHAAHQYHLALPTSTQLVPVYYAAHALKFRQTSAGLLGPPPTAVERTPTEAIRRFDDAMERWDPDAAEQAVVDLLSSLPTEEAVEHLIRWSAREQGSIGHMMIWFALGIRSLDALGWHHGQPVARSIVRDATTRPQTHLADMYTLHRARLQTTAPTPGPCGADDGVSRELVHELRRGDPSSAAALVMELVERSTPPRAIWDGLVVSGVEHLLRRGAGVALHRFDGANALHHLFRRSGDTLSRQVLLVQAAAYMAGFEMPDGVDVLALDPIAVDELDEVFDAIADGPLDAGQRAMGWLAGGGTLAALRARAEELAIQKAHPVDEHNYKFPIAMFEEAALASPEFQALVVAAIGGEESRSPATSRDDWEHLDEVLDEIAKLGR